MEEIHTLQPVLALLLLGILSMVICRPLGQSPIVGYLVGGLLVGPQGFGLIQPDHTTQLLAELGVVFLLFDIGLHFSLGHIWEARRTILGLGPLQIVLCTAAFAGIGMLVGLDTEIALVLGAALALSSTAVAVQTLAENQRLRCPIGVSATAILVFQDICAIFLLILAASLGTEGGNLATAVGGAVVKAALAFVAAITLGRVLIGPLFRLIAGTKQEEAFTASALLLVLATGVATGLMGLSLTLGAFLAGMIISETAYRHVLRTEIKPFRGLLVGFFFITVGMSLDPRVLAESWHWVLAGVAVLVTIKFGLIVAAGLAFGTPTHLAVQLGATLFQGSEFAFVVLAAPAVNQALGTTTVALLIATVAVSMALTPAAVALANRLSRRTAESDWACRAGQESAETPTPVILFGMNEIGRRVADALEAHEIPFKAFEIDHDRFVRAETDGYPVAFGDIADLRLVESLEMSGTTAVVGTVARYEISAELTPVVQERYPQIERFVSVADEADRDRFQELGMRGVIDRSHPPGLDLARVVLAAQGVEDEDIAAWSLRQQDLELRAEEDRDHPVLPAAV